MADLITREQNVALNNTALALPKYTELSETRVVKEMQVVFKGFEFDKDFNPLERFKTAEQVEAYAKTSIKELDEADNKFKIGAIMNAGAIAAKRWHFGFMIARCLSSANYGSDLATKIATAANISPSYLYQYRAVGERLTLKDAYILGMYGAGWECIRKLAALNDDIIRSSLIRMFIDSIPDWNNSIVREKAKEQLNLAIENMKKAPEAAQVASPAELEAVANFDKEAPEFIDCNKQMETIKSAIRGFIKPKKVEAFINAAENCYLPDTVVGAQERLDAFHTSCNEALEMLQEMENIIPTIRENLQSLSQMPLSSNE